MLSLLDHVRRHYDPHDSVITRDDAGQDRLAFLPSTGAETEPGLVVYRFGVGLFYANAARFTEEAIALVSGPEPPRWFVLLANAVDDVDYTGGKTLVELAGQLEARGVVFAVADVRHAVRPELERFGLTDKIGEERIFATLEDAVAAFRASKPPSSRCLRGGAALAAPPRLNRLAVEEGSRQRVPEPLSRRSPPRPTARRAPPSRHPASRSPSSSTFRSAGPGRS